MYTWGLTMTEINDVTVFGLNVVCNGSGLFIEYAKPSDDSRAGRVLKQYGADANKYQAVRDFYTKMDEELLKVLRA